LKLNILFCLPLGIGAAISGVLFVIGFKYLFDTYEKATYFLFVGLISGNLPVIFTEIKKRGFKKRYLIGTIGAFAAALAFSVFSKGVGQSTSTEGLTASLLILVLSGATGGVATLIPGMSVSMVLIIFGVYDELIFAVHSLLYLDFTFLAPFGIFAACALAGLMITSKGIKFVFERYPGFANAMVFGFMVGSLIGILIHSLHLKDPNFNWLLGGIMLAVGLGISMLFVILARIMGEE